jgi:hypothetical protein
VPTLDGRRPHVEAFGDRIADADHEDARRIAAAVADDRDLSKVELVDRVAPDADRRRAVLTRDALARKLRQCWLRLVELIGKHKPEHLVALNAIASEAG